VIAAKDVRVNVRRLHSLDERLRNEKVVDAPPHIARARVREVRPPRVEPVPLMKETEGVDEARLEIVLKPARSSVVNPLRPTFDLGLARSSAV